MNMRSLRVRLLAGAAAFILVALALAAFALTSLFERHVTQWMDSELANHLDQLIAGIDRDAAGKIVIARTPADPRFQKPLSGLYWQVEIDPAGPVYRSRSLWDATLDLPAEAVIDDDVRSYELPGPAAQSLHVVERRIALPARLDGKTARIAVGIDAADLAAAKRNFAGALLPYLALLALLLIAAGSAQVAIGLRPLAAIRQRLTAIGAGTQTRLGNDFPEEVMPLVSEIDAQLDARERQIEKARARAADLAHGLKTPLQVLASDAERLHAKGESEIAGEIDDIRAIMQRHIERELTRARSSAANMNVTTELLPIAQRVLRVAQRTPAGERITWTTDIAPQLAARIDADDLTEALGNLVENATRHAASAITLRAQTEGDAIALAVLDDGPGMSAEDAEIALRRGGRLDTSGSAGLGLAIVGDIMEAWDGALNIETSAPGGNMVLRLPAAIKHKPVRRRP